MVSWLITRTPSSPSRRSTSATARHSTAGRSRVNNRLGLVPRSRFFGEPGDNSVSEAGIVQIRLDHAFNADWQLRVAGHFNTGSLTGLQTGATGLLDDGRTSCASSAATTSPGAWPSGRPSSSGTSTPGHSPTPCCSAWSTSATIDREPSALDAADRPFAIDLFNPVYGQPKPPFTRRYSASENVGNTAVYAQDQIALSPEWKLLLATGPTSTTRRSATRSATSAPSRTGSASRPRGLVYQPLSFLSFYGNVAASFRPNTGFDIATRPFAPETGFGYEAGVKLDLFTGLSVTGAAFHIEKENVLTTDPRDFFFQIAAGAVRSQGFDLSLVGQVTPNSG